VFYSLASPNSRIEWDQLANRWCYYRIKFLHHWSRPFIL